MSMKGTARNEEDRINIQCPFYDCCSIILRLLQLVALRFFTPAEGCLSTLVHYLLAG